MKERRALGLFSGGLDSILACRVVADQGVRVTALKFVTPFFDHDLLAEKDAYADAMRRKYGLDVTVIDISEGYLRLLDNPAHGFGKHFNPCIDCKILMLTRARELMSSYGASFLLTGEVLGQRPMSQRRDTLRVIERDSGCTGLLLRPLCAKLLPPTRAELTGQVDRKLLHGFSGRSRKEQKQLAARLGISDYPAPAGGCLLTDPNLAARIKHFYQGFFSFDGQRAVDDVRLLTIGRQFRLDDGIWLILGRDEQENARLLTMRGLLDDWLLHMPTRPGPLGLLRHARNKVAGTNREAVIIRRAAGLVVRFGKKEQGGITAAEVLIDKGNGSEQGVFAPLLDDEFAAWRF
ncbi:MAG: thiamine biosynthesis protein [Desulfobulbus sp.]|nr:thiamine biosynthesis protein [Desulfobulbus sp.]